MVRQAEELELSEKLGPRIRQLRRRAGLTQAQLALRMGVCGQRISQLELGSAERAGLTGLGNLAKLLGTNLSALLAGTRRGLWEGSDAIRRHGIPREDYGIRHLAAAMLFRAALDLAKGKRDVLEFLYSDSSSFWLWCAILSLDPLWVRTKIENSAVSHSPLRKRAERRAANRPGRAAGPALLGRKSGR